MFLTACTISFIGGSTATKVIIAGVEASIAAILTTEVPGTNVVVTCVDGEPTVGGACRPAPSARVFLAANSFGLVELKGNEVKGGEVELVEI